MKVKTQIRLAKELKKFGYVLGLALALSIITYAIAKYYEKEEYTKYIEEKRKWEQEENKRIAEFEKQKTKFEKQKADALSQLQEYVLNDKKLLTYYIDYKRKSNLRSETIALISFVRNGLNQGCFDKKSTKMLILLFDNYENFNLDFKYPPREQYKSFSIYQEYLPDAYPLIRKIPPFEFSCSIFCVLVLLYIELRVLYSLILLLIKGIRWINKTSKLSEE
ncbi:hypothetical protein [Bacteroides rodentium]|uniref:hypothetical protein n=1 Tax=Bacteroides rodentium TaxID=691816 RepID=UPI000471E57C|nr:hypothetical protein [Bacteroides rodentium]